jgi:hypothetical protein
MGEIVVIYFGPSLVMLEVELLRAIPTGCGGHWMY